MVAQAVPPTTIMKEGKSKNAQIPTPMLMEMTKRPTEDKMPIIVATSMGVHLEKLIERKNRPKRLGINP
jgi:hypothetical protein